MKYGNVFRLMCVSLSLDIPGPEIFSQKRHAHLLWERPIKGRAINKFINQGPHISVVDNKQSLQLIWPFVACRYQCLKMFVKVKSRL